MSQIVRRANQNLQSVENSDVGAVQTHRGEGITVESQLAIGARPELHLYWTIQPSYSAAGCTLMVFHSRTGFCSESDPDDLSKHGNLIIETAENGSRLLYPEEGLHFLTFLLRKKPGIFRIFWEERSEPLRFSEMVPSVKVALGRIKDQIDLKEQGHQMQLMPMRHEVELNDAQIALQHSRKKRAELENPRTRPPPEQHSPAGNDSVIDAELGRINRFLDAVLASETAHEHILRDPRFQKLSKEGKERVLDQIKKRFDPGELRARQERHRS